MTVILSLDDSGPLKRVLVEMAYGQCGIAGYEFGHSAEEIRDGLTLLEAMMYEHPWNLLGYEHSADGVGDGSEHSNIPFDAMSAVALSLANRLAPTKGVALSAEQTKEMARSRLLVSSSYAVMASMPFANATPRGAGSRLSGPFIRETLDVA